MEGISNCTKCHDLGNQVTDKKCLDCHKEIRESISSKRGYHYSPAVQKKHCRECHSEHFGRDFRLIRFSENNFDHSLTGFKLTGKHENTGCAECHTSEVRKRINRKTKTYLGLSPSCNSCHRDQHEGTLGTDCASCHSTGTFKKAENFDHNKAEFRLLQAHANVTCDKCHPVRIKNGKSFQKFTGLQFANCYPCHNDVHNNKLGKDCKSCHIVAGFRFINRNAFNHNSTQFPLLGKHSAVSCAQCHKSGISVKPAFDKCVNCHADYHSGEFAANGLSKDCSFCHNTQGFTPSLFTLDDHKSSKFPLEGKHLAVDCEKCHHKEDKWRFRIASASCENCHVNVHDKFASVENISAGDCQSCHTVQDWNVIRFDHSLTDFALTGKHAELSCRKCHSDPSVSSVHFTGTTSDCMTCHKDPHNHQFSKNENFTDCSQCHTSEGWKPSTFDHSTARFRLDGRHLNVPCSKCHHEKTSEGITYIVYKQENIRCSACHS